MRFDCRCERPVRSPNPRRKDTCVACSGWVNPAWDSTSPNLAAFFERLAESAPDAWLDAFREHCELRELTGREKFGHSYLVRNNPVEATEEAADGALYIYLDGLRLIREGHSDDALDVRLCAAYHFAQAHRYCRMLLAKRAGSTGPGMDE